MYHIMWECQNEECKLEFTTKPIDFPICPECGDDNVIEIGQAEVILRK